MLNVKRWCVVCDSWVYDVFMPDYGCRVCWNPTLSKADLKAVS